LLRDRTTRSGSTHCGPPPAARDFVSVCGSIATAGIKHDCAHRPAFALFGGGKGRRNNGIGLFEAEPTHSSFQIPAALITVPIE
jgi:hypothetical protein